MSMQHSYDLCVAKKTTDLSAVQQVEFEAA
jgi:hypothetical protein